MTTTTERTVQGWRVSAIINNTRVSVHYIGYTKRDAMRTFRREHTKQGKH